MMSGDSAWLVDAVGTLMGLWLVKRKRDAATLSVHCRVQAMLRASLDEGSRRAWAEHVVRAVHQAFPDVKDYRIWPRCQQYLPHVDACASLIDHYAFAFPEAARLCNNVGYYLKQRAQYPEAEAYYQRAIAIGEKTLGPEHPDLAIRYNNLASLYYVQGKYAEAEPLFQRAIAIDEQTLGPEHPDLATDYNNLARLYAKHGKDAEAELLFQCALPIREQKFGPHQPST